MKTLICGGASVFALTVLSSTVVFAAPSTGDDIENNVWETVKQEMQPSGPKRNFRLWYSVTGGLVAASIALLIVFNLLPHHPRTNFEDVEKAFANLSSSDQDYLFATYQNDLFMNE